MQFQRVNRTNAERAMGVCENRSGASILGNYPVCFTTTSGSNDGYQVTTPLAANVFTFGGIADADIADAGVGLFQCYGYRDSVRIFATGSSGTVEAGVVMGPAASSNGVNSTGSVDTYGPIISMEAVPAATTSPGGYAKGFIRAL